MSGWGHTRAKQALRLLPLLLVLLVCNSETRQLLSTTLQHILGAVCPEASCGTQATAPGGEAQSLLVLPTQPGPGLEPVSLPLVYALLMAGVLWAARNATPRSPFSPSSPRAPPA